MPAAEASPAARSPLVPGLSLVLPAYDEEAGIVDAVLEADRALAGLAVEHEVLVVDDGSRDSTAARVGERFAGRGTVRLLRHAENRGYGAALRTGFTAARFELVAFTDADRQFYVEDLALLLDAMGGHDAACGYRIDRQDPWLRLVYSRGYNRLVRHLLGVPTRDCDCALKLFHRRVLEGLTIETDGFMVNAEILAKLRAGGASIAEVGVRHRSREAGESTVSFLHAFPVLFALLGFWWSGLVFPALRQGGDAVSLPPPS